MKLIKINTDHYVVVDDSKIEVGDWYIDDAKQIRQSVVSDEVYWQHRPYNREYMKITHSTQPLDERRYWGKVMPLTLTISEIKELIGEVDVEKKAYEYAINDFDDYVFCGYVKGYNQALEDNKEKKYTDEDMLNAFREGTNAGALHERLSDYDNGDYEDAEQYSEQYEESFIQSLQPKTQWEVEIVDGKLKLKN